MQRNILLAYYAGTAVFLLLDYGLDINVRVAFLETLPGLRVTYYGVLFGCLALMLWYPSWSRLVGTIESLVTLVALIVNMALRSMIVTDAMLETGAGFVTMPEIVNFLIAGGAAYVSWLRGMNALAKEPWR